MRAVMNTGVSLYHVPLSYQCYRTDVALLSTVRQIVCVFFLVFLFFFFFWASKLSEEGVIDCLYISVLYTCSSGFHIIK